VADKTNLTKSITFKIPEMGKCHACGGRNKHNDKIQVSSKSVSFKNPEMGKFHAHCRYNPKK
jgi:hypothetical protein